VKKYAVSKSIPVLQPEKLKAESFLQTLKSFNATLQIVVAFRMLPEVVWNMPPLGTINVHGSLLPQYRGAAPINWAIINGEKETGVTTFQLKHEIDTGNILLQSKLAIGDDENCGSVHNRMMKLGAETLAQTLELLLVNKLTPMPQSAVLPQNMHHAPKIFTETCLIQWNRNAYDIHNHIRGLSPYPAAITHLNGKLLKVFAAKAIVSEHKNAPGQVVTDKKTYLHFSCANGYIAIEELQLEGKKRMQVIEFLRGYHW
ncbi:MAG: methionyl-tRNA formyltransferase, partial [Chitinophagaceae bacterium]